MPWAMAPSGTPDSYRPESCMAHLDFGRSINPISTRGTDYAHLLTTGTPRFSDLPKVLSCTALATAPVKLTVRRAYLPSKRIYCCRLPSFFADPTVASCVTKPFLKFSSGIVTS